MTLIQIRMGCGFLLFAPLASDLMGYGIGKDNYGAWGICFIVICWIFCDAEGFRAG